MRWFLPTWLDWFAGLLAPKATPAPPPRGAVSSGPIDAFNRRREPSPSDLLKELKATAWTCASINAAVCASFPPKLYVRTATGQRQHRLAARALLPSHLLAVLHKNAAQVEEVLDHPILDLFRQVNP